MKKNQSSKISCLCLFNMFQLSVWLVFCHILTMYICTYILSWAIFCFTKIVHSEILLCISFKWVNRKPHFAYGLQHVFIKNAFIVECRHFKFLYYVPGDDIMHFTDSCQFLISSAFKFTALLPQCGNIFLPHWLLEFCGSRDRSRVLSET